VIRRSHAADPDHANAWVALRNAFNAAKRRLQENEKVVRGVPRARDKPASAQVNAD